MSEYCLKDLDQVLSKNRGMSLRWPPIASEAIGDDICERLFFSLKEGFSDLSQPLAGRASQTFSNPVGGALIYLASNYDSTVRFVGDDHRKRTSRRRAPETTRIH